MARSQAQRVDRILSETLERLRLQLVHIDQILTGGMEAVEEAGSRLRGTFWGPVVRATAVIRGIQTGLGHCIGFCFSHFLFLLVVTHMLQPQSLQLSIVR
jgi:hypothetical protein